MRMEIVSFEGGTKGELKFYKFADGRKLRFRINNSKVGVSLSAGMHYLFTLPEFGAPSSRIEVHEIESCFHPYEIV